MKSHLLFVNTILLVSLINQIYACGPGRAGGRRRMLRKYPPLVQRQYIPNVSENTLGASGKPEGAITRKDKRFKELVQNWNPDIEFRDDERTGADRMMSQRLKEKLSTLAISVMNQWPNVKLRVIEGWDEDNRHSMNSLHYEGRAVDITTSDRDKTKYGMLARLAVEAGFDWVHYESRSHVHCSVKSEKADTIRNNGCFDSTSLVETPEGFVEMSQLQTNDLVLTMNSKGQLKFSPIIMWLDKDESGQELFVELKTKSNRLIRLTSSHLIYVADEPFDLTHSSSLSSSTAKTINDYDGEKQQQLLSEQLKPVLNKIDSGNINIKQEYYHYNVDNPTATTISDAKLDSDYQAESNMKTTKNVPNSYTTGPKMDQPEDTQVLLGSTSFSIDDFAYTTYSRNVVVGQYLLINLPTPAQNESEILPANRMDSSIQQEDSLERTIEFAATTPNINSLPIRNIKYNLGGVNDPTFGRLMYNNNLEDVVQEDTDRKSVSTTPSSDSMVEFDQIVSVNYKIRRGIYAPLTREGNIVVNSVVASCYAVISDQELAHMSFAPVRWFSYLKEWLFGLISTETMKPLRERTVEAIGMSNEKDGKLWEDDGGKQDTQLIQPINIYRVPTRLLTYTKDTLETPTLSPKSTRREIHWYPMMLYSIARFILPSGYLY